MLLFKDMDLFPGGETLGEVPAFNSEADTMKDGNVGILQVLRYDRTPIHFPGHVTPST